MGVSENETLVSRSDLFYLRIAAAAWLSEWLRTHKDSPDANNVKEALENTKDKVWQVRG